MADTDVKHLDELFVRIWNEPLDLIVKELIRQPILSDYLDDHSKHRLALIALTQTTVERFKAGSEAHRHTLHKTLGHIYALHVSSPNQRPVFNQYDPTLIEIQRKLERAWEQFENARIPKMDPPSDAQTFANWYKRLVVHEHPASTHPIFEYLANEATRRELRAFFLNEITVDSRFDDLVALSQIAMEPLPKMELAENYWDEMGNGKQDAVHTYMFNHLLNELGLNTENLNSLFDEVHWTSIACGNLLLYSVIHRQNIYKALGAMGAVEMLAPKRFHKLVAGFERLGLSQTAQEYHRLHIAIDARHGLGWLRNAIAPAAENNPTARREIIQGAYYRLNTSLDYCNHLLATFKGIRKADAATSDAMSG